MENTSLKEVEIVRKTGQITDYYREQFKRLYGQACPDPDEEDLKVVRWAVQAYELGQLKQLLQLYLTFDNDWIKEQGYPLRLFRKSVAGIIVKNANVDKANRPVWVVAISETGFPVVSYNQFEMKDYPFNYKPVLYEEWLKQSVQEKLQHPRERWEAVGNNVEAWLLLWKENGYLP